MFHSNGFLNLQKGLLIALTIPTPPILKIQEEENEESFVYHKVAFPPPQMCVCISKSLESRNLPPILEILKSQGSRNFGLL